ncbi:hypothetical protein IFM89_015665, partial [Coptis chinensis]
MVGLSDGHRGLVGEPNQAREVPETEQEQQITEARVVQPPILEGDARFETEVHTVISPPANQGVFNCVHFSKTTQPPQVEIRQPEDHPENVVECIQPTKSTGQPPFQIYTTNNFDLLNDEESVPETQSQVANEVHTVCGRWSDDMVESEEDDLCPQQQQPKTKRGRPKGSKQADERVWTPELRGNFTVKSAFVEIRSTLATTCWSRVVWKNSIHPQLSAIAWKLVHKKFQVEATFASFAEAINMGTCLSPRLLDLWLSAILGGAASLWKHRNKLFHENFRSNLRNIGVTTSYVSECITILEGIEIVVSKGHTAIWVESDSKDVVATYNTKNIPWQLKARWQ